MLVLLHDLVSMPEVRLGLREVSVHGEGHGTPHATNHRRPPAHIITQRPAYHPAWLSVNVLYMVTYIHTHIDHYTNQIIISI